MFTRTLTLTIAVILATLAFSLWGFVWYATVFDDVWQSLIARSEQELIDMAIARGHWNDVLVLAVSFGQALGVLLALQLSRARSFLQYMCVAAGLASLIVLPALGNATIFAGTPALLLLLDYGHFLCGYAGMALVFFILVRQHIGNGPRA